MQGLLRCGRHGASSDFSASPRLGSCSNAGSVSVHVWEFHLCVFEWMRMRCSWVWLRIVGSMGCLHVSACVCFVSHSPSSVKLGALLCLHTFLEKATFDYTRGLEHWLSEGPAPSALLAMCFAGMRF